MSQTLADLKRVRRSKSAADLETYRGIVRDLAEGREADEPIESLDQLLTRLGVSEDDVAADVAVLKEHARLKAAVSEFKSVEREGVNERVVKLTAEIAVVREQLLKGPNRLAQLQAQRYNAGNAHHADGGRQLRMREIEAANARLFGRWES